jgi:hypothetical protein
VKTEGGKVRWAAAWAWISITVWTGTPVLLMWHFLPRQAASTYVVAGLLGVNLLSFYFFSWMAADPRGGWGQWWQRERRDGTSNFAIARTVFALALLWAFMGIAVARLSWKKREELTEQLNQEDARWFKAHSNHA